MIAPRSSRTQRAVRLGLVDAFARRLLMDQLQELRFGELRLCDSAGVTHFGQPGDLGAAVQVHRPPFFRRALLGGSLAMAAGYIEGDWDCDDLTSLFRLFVRNQSAATRVDGAWSHVARLGHRLGHWFHANSRAGSRANILAHYDLGNDFFRLWLDDSLAYSCGIFPSADATLHEASIEKFDRICRKLDLRPTDHLLEIGTGWGGLAIHAARHYGCRVTTTTISQQQFETARERIDDAGLTNRVTLLNRDYRDLTGRFDKLVSIEMIEAVGYRYLDTYFRKCDELLKPDGSFLLQAIVMPEQGYDAYLRSTDFIQRYVFPGGCLPSIGAIQHSIGRASHWRLVHAEDFAPHYARTLRLWREAFNDRLDDVRRLGYSEAFLRLWNYYLCYCEAAFAERHTGVVQMLFDAPECRRDPLEISASAVGRAASRSPVSLRHAAAGNPAQCAENAP